MKYFFEVFVIFVALFVFHLFLPLGFHFQGRLFADEVAGIRRLGGASIVEPPLQLAAILPVFLVSFQVVIIPC